MAATEWTDYGVTLTLRVHTSAGFAPPQESRPTKADAIEHAIDHLPPDLAEHFARWGFTLAEPIDGEATEDE
jgi:hypothetical protein